MIEPQRASGRPSSLGGAVRRVLVVDPVEAEAAQPALGPLVRTRVAPRAAGAGAWNAVSNTATCGTPKRSSATATPARPAALCSGASAQRARRPP